MLGIHTSVAPSGVSTGDMGSSQVPGLSSSPIYGLMEQGGESIPHSLVFERLFVSK
jgi:hypothetical protein